MICVPCAKAGNNISDEGDDTPKLLKILHDHCAAPTTCPCQHGTESIIIHA